MLLRRMLIGLTLLLAAPAMAQERVVNFLNWSDYIDPAVLEQFTKETGIKVVHDVMDSNEAIEARIITGKSGYDLAVPTGMFLQRQIAAGVYQPLDKSKLKNYGNLWPVITERLAAFDPGLQHSIPYMFFTIGLGYNVDKVKEILGKDAPLKSWRLLFDPKIAEQLSKCGIWVIDSPEEMIPVTLHYLGRDPNSTDPKDLEDARETWAALSKFVRQFSSGDYINAIANGDVCLVAAYSGDLLQARDRAKEANSGVKIEFVVPDEGGAILIDAVAMLKDAPNREEAYALLDFLMRPDIAAQITNYVHFGNGNLPAQKLVEPDILNDPAVYPDEATLQRMFTILPYDEKTRRAVTRLWTRVKTGR